MMTILKIEVTQENINKALKLSPYSCPIALAWRRTFPTGPLPSVGPKYVHPFDTERVVLLPRRAQEFITEFDRVGSEGVGPFTMEIAVDDILYHQIMEGE